MPLGWLLLWSRNSSIKQRRRAWFRDEEMEIRSPAIPANAGSQGVKWRTHWGKAETLGVSRDEGTASFAERYCSCRCWVRSAAAGDGWDPSLSPSLNSKPKWQRLPHRRDMAPLSLGKKKKNENSRVCVEQSRIQSDKQGLHYLSEASSLIEKENNREKNIASHRDQAGLTRTMGTQVNIAGRHSVWPFEVLWQGNALDQSQMRSIWGEVKPVPYHISVSYMRHAGFAVML